MSIFENSNSLLPETVQYNSKECKNTKKKKQRYFEVYISKLLKNISPESSLTLNVKQQLNSCLTIIVKEISDYAMKLTFFSGKKTLSEKEIDNSVKIIFPDDMYNLSNEYVNSKITNYKTDKGKYNSRQYKAGIIFPPSICERFLRNFGYNNIMITEISPIYLASIIEFITETILVKAVERSQTRNKIRITIRDLDISVKTDSNLEKLFHTLKISFLGGGVIPYIHYSLLVKKPRKKKKIDNEIDKKNHRFRPGTVSIREIKKIQKTSDCLIFSKLPFERLVRSIIRKYNNTKISKDVFIVLQYYIEQYIISFLEHCNKATIHASRVKLMKSDIMFICSLKKLNEIDIDKYAIEQQNIDSKEESKEHI